MKKIKLFFALIFSVFAFSQKTFKATNGKEYKIGDTITLNSPSLQNEEYKSMMLSFPAQRVSGDLKNYKFVVDKIKIYNNAVYKNVGMFSGKFAGIKGLGTILMTIDEAIKSDEIQ